MNVKEGFRYVAFTLIVSMLCFVGFWSLFTFVETVVENSTGVRVECEPSGTS